MSAVLPTILQRIAVAGDAYQQEKIGSREDLIELGRDLMSTLEIPSEFLQRSFWAEPALSAHCKFAVKVNLFQHLRDANEDGITLKKLAQKTGVDPMLLKRILRHLVAMKLISFSAGSFYGTPLTDGLAAQNYQKSLEFCYDVARPSFNGFPAFFSKTNYEMPISLTDGPFQDAHDTRLPFFEWLVATPPHLDQFDNFMSAYRAGKASWYNLGFYPVAERLINGFDINTNSTLLVDVGGGRGHDVEQFIAQHKAHTGKIVLQDREPVIASIQSREHLLFECQAHDFFRPQPIHGARAYSLHSILHDWSDEDGVRILKNLAPALKPGYSRVLLNEIVLSEDKPTIAATSMDMMTLAHFAVRERTEAEWKAILEQAGLKFLQVYGYPGVAESVIEAQLGVKDWKGVGTRHGDVWIAGVK